MFEATAILLAAGLSRRMGGENKLLLPVKGTPMVRHVVDQYSKALDGPVLVILGHAADHMGPVLEGTRAKTLVNPNFAQGQNTSVAAGVIHAAAAKSLLIGLCDQPILQAQDISDLLAAHRAADPRKISIPSNGNKRGNPIVVPKPLRQRLLEDPNAPGCRKFTRTHPDCVQHVELESDGFYFDIDTPEDYATFLRSAQNGAI